MPEKKRRSPARITNSKTFEAAIWTAFEPYAVKLIDDDRAWRKSMQEGHPQGPLPVQQRAVRRDDLLLHLIFQAFHEVTTSLDTLCNIPFYMRHAPPSVSRRATSATWRGLSTTRSAWVRYHVENYFHELYIFQNRVEAFFTLLRRTYRKQTDSTKLNEQCDLLEKALKHGFEGVVKTRGSHVHESRFDDATLRTLEGVEFIARLKKNSAREYSQWLQEALAEKVFWMTANNAAIRKWLDDSGRVLGGLLFMENGAFRFPSPPQMGSTPSALTTT